MPITRRERFIYTHLAWMMATVLMLALLEVLSYVAFFLISMIGFLVLIERTAPVRITPTWRRRLRLVVVLSLLGVAYLVGRQVIALVPPEVF